MAIRTWSKDQDKQQAIITKLRAYRSIKMKYDANKQLYESLYPGATAKLTDEPRGGTQEFNATEQIVNARIDLRTIMDRSLNQMREEISEIVKIINLIPENRNFEKTVIVRRYTLAESWEQIAETIGKCDRQVRRYHETGIQIISDKCP